MSFLASMDESFPLLHFFPLYDNIACRIVYCRLYCNSLFLSWMNVVTSLLLLPPPIGMVGGRFLTSNSFIHSPCSFLLCNSNAACNSLMELKFGLGCEQDGTKGSEESTESNKIPVQPQQQQQLQPHPGQTPAREAAAAPIPFCCSSAGCLLNESDGLASSDFLHGGAGGGLFGSSGVSVVGNTQKTSSISSFPRSPSSVSRGGYLSLTTVHSPNKLSCESANQSPKGSGFLSSRRNNRKPLLVRSEVSSDTQVANEPQLPLRCPANPINAPSKSINQ